MADEERKKSFWETLPGIITALAALLTGVAAVIAALNGGAKESAPQPSPQPAQVPVVQAAPVNLPSAAEEAARAKAEAEAAKAREAEWKQKLAEAEQRAAAENAARQAAAEEAAAAKARAEEAERRAAAVEAARKGTTIGKYIDHGDGTITDTETGLMWKRCSEGLSGVNCEEGKAEEYTWNDAVQRFKNVEYADYSDWRLPTVDELKTLVYCSKGKDEDGDCNNGSEKPTINQQAFPDAEEWVYWSGSPYPSYSGYAWCVFFNVGSSVACSRNVDYAVRLVRGGQRFDLFASRSRAASLLPSRGKAPVPDRIGGKYPCNFSVLWYIVLTDCGFS